MQSKENRGKEKIMCEFCENKPIISHIKQSIDGIGTIVCGIDGNLLKASSMVQTSTGIYPPIVGEAKINYCPMCGRKLV